MTTADLLRIVVLALAGSGIGLMLVITVVAMKVLHPAPQRAGFLWWHILTISLGVTGLIVSAAGERLELIEHPANWRLPVSLISMLLVDVALVLIFRVEYDRMVHKNAQDQVRCGR